jgi:hypothetical protein
MGAIEAIAFAGGAGFAVIVVATILVIIGVRQEQAVLERDQRRTFSHREPPTILARLARRVLGAHFAQMPERLPGPELPGDEPPDPPPWYERPVGPRAG